MGSFETDQSWKKVQSEGELLLIPGCTRAFKKFSYLGPTPETVICWIGAGPVSVFLTPPRVILTCSQGRGPRVWRQLLKP